MRKIKRRKIVDDTLASRIYMAPSKYSVAGPEEAYRYWITQFNSSISDVYLDSPEAGQVLIEFILEGGQLPNEAMISALGTYLTNENIRPLTDLVLIQAPATASFNVSVQYWINKSDTYTYCGTHSYSSSRSECCNFHRPWYQRAAVGGSGKQHYYPGSSRR